LSKGKGCCEVFQPDQAWNIRKSPLLSTCPHVNPNLSVGQRREHDLSWANKDLTDEAGKRALFHYSNEMSAVTVELKVLL
jgi:hypothetical protein